MPSERRELVMSGPPGESLSIHLHCGRTSIAVGTYELAGGDVAAKADAIDRLVRHVLNEWPRLVYSDQLQKLVRKECSNAKK
jgi:hypothetical protein